MPYCRAAGRLLRLAVRFCGGCDMDRQFDPGIEHTGLSQGRVPAHLACLAGCGYVQVRRAFRLLHVADPRVADLVTLARSLAADNAAALAECVRIAPATAGQPGAVPAALP